MILLCRNVKLRYRLVLKKGIRHWYFFLKNKLIIIFIHQCQKLLFVMFRCVQIFDSFLLAIMMHQTYPVIWSHWSCSSTSGFLFGLENYWDIKKILVVHNDQFSWQLLNYASIIRQSNELINLKRLEFTYPCNMSISNFNRNACANNHDYQTRFFSVKSLTY